ncbi:MAG: HAMP domain-containing histidine kinase [Actinomycetota bacterium]|nr:HAMP domain-containing histidine kinase [Actinomycetota bacterium]
MTLLGGSLRSRLFLATAVIVVVSLGITLAVGTVLTRRSVEQATLRDLSRQADLLQQRERRLLLAFSDIKDVRTLLKPQGTHFDPVDLRRPSTLLTAAERATLLHERPVDVTKTIDGERQFVAARHVVAGKQPRGLVIRKPVGEADWTPFLEALLLAALVGATLAAAAAVLLARAIARPVGRVARASRSLASGESPQPLPVEGPEELATLAASFNHMASELAKARAAERSFLLSVSHELKTPLTAIRGYAEGLAEGAFTPDEAGETIAREAGRLERLVRDLLDLARMNKSEFSVDMQRIDLGEIAHEAVHRYEAHAHTFDIALEASAPAEAPALGDPDRVLQVVSNLVENALRVTPRGGAVRVEARRGTISVEDTGPGLRAEELPRAFERFFLYSRYGAERPVGTGLGLAIVRELTTTMGGNVEVQSEPGRGTRFTVRLPAPAAVLDGSRGRVLAPSTRR